MKFWSFWTKVQNLGINFMDFFELLGCEGSEVS